MDPVNNLNTTNDTPQIYEASSLTEEHLDSATVILLLQSSNASASQAMDRVGQNLEKLSNRITNLEESNETQLVQIDRIIKSMKESEQTLQNISKTSSEIKEITERAANFVKRFFNPVRNGLQNGFCFLTGHGAPAAVLPGENQLAIEYTPESTTSVTEPTNQSSVNEKKKFPNLLKLFLVVSGLSFLYIEGRKIFWYSSLNSRLD